MVHFMQCLVVCLMQCLMVFFMQCLVVRFMSQLGPQHMLLQCRTVEGIGRKKAIQIFSKAFMSSLNVEVFLCVWVRSVAGDLLGPS